MNSKEVEIAANESRGVHVIVVDSVAALVLILRSKAIWESLPGCPANAIDATIAQEIGEPRRQI